MTPRVVVESASKPPNRSFFGQAMQDYVNRLTTAYIQEIAGN